MTPSNNPITYFGPPKPNAIATIMMTSSYNHNHHKKKEEELSSIQTLLYSIQKSIEMNNNYDNYNNNDDDDDKKKKKKKGFVSNSYPPEIIVLLIDNNNNDYNDQNTNNIEHIKEELDCFCTRIIYIKKEISPTLLTTTKNKIQNQFIHGTIQLLNQVVYNLILYIDSNCLVQNDICHLFQPRRNGMYMYNLNGLVNAVSAPILDDDDEEEEVEEGKEEDEHKKDFFDTTVMMIKPCYEVYNNKIHTLQLYIQSVQVNNNNKNHHHNDNHNDDRINVRLYCNQFWNKYFQQNWYQLDNKYRLGIEYNYYENNDCMVSRRNIIAKGKKNWDVVYIYNKNYYSYDNRLFINQLYSKWTKKCMLYKENYKEKQNLVQRAKKDIDLRKKNQGVDAMMKNTISSSLPSSTSSSRQNQMVKHKLVSKRYKELRKQGNDPKEAMRIARSDYGMDKADESQASVNTQVASMFGMGGLF